MYQNQQAWKTLTTILKEIQRQLLKLVTERKERLHTLVMEFCNQKSLSDRNLPIIPMKMDPIIEASIETCGGTPNMLVTPTTK